MNARPKINAQNLKRFCWSKGFSISDLAARLGRHRTTIHRAVANPRQFRPTYARIVEVLCE